MLNNKLYLVLAAGTTLFLLAIVVMQVLEARVLELF